MESLHDDEPSAFRPEHVDFGAPYEAPENVDEFFERNVGVFQTIDEFWVEVRAASNTFSELIVKPMSPLPGKQEADGTVVGGFTWLEQGNRSESRTAVARAARPFQRMGEKLRGLAGEDMLAMEDFIEETITSKAVYSPLVTRSVITAVSSMIREAKLEIKRKRPPSNSLLKVDMPPELSDASDALYESYRRAYLAQAVGVQRIEHFLADDAHVQPFVDRIFEQATLARYGMQEFPGFLETAATHLAQKSTGNIFARAFERVAAAQRSKEAFVDLLLQEDVSNIKLPKQLMPQLAAVYVVSQAVEQDLSDGHIRHADLVRAVAARFDQLPREWQDAYAAYLRQYVQEASQSFAHMLEPFVRRMRLLTGDASDRLSQQGQDRSSPRKTTNLKRGVRPLPQKSDVISPSESDEAAEREPAPLDFFAVMKSHEGSNKVFLIERKATMAELMQHDIVTNFLNTHRNEPNLEARIHGFIEQLAERPFDPTNTQVLRDRGFSINDTGASGSVKYSRRRFRSRRTTSDEGGKSALLNRVRITYGVAVIDGRQCLLIDEISLRDESSYRN